ncbi:GreA/GreB family elongation factor (plasmid) [Coraliomargarita sp. W4R53]
MATDPVWMTPTARQQLEAELAVLESNASTTEGSASSRAREIRSLLRHAEVDRKPDDGLVETGMRVTVRFDSDQSTTTFLLGSREISGLDPDLDVDIYSPTSPLGSAISGRYVGDSVTFTAPSGTQQITIIEAVPFG